MRPINDLGRIIRISSLLSLLVLLILSGKFGSSFQRCHSVGRYLFSEGSSHDSSTSRRKKRLPPPPVKLKSNILPPVPSPSSEQHSEQELFDICSRIALRHFRFASKKAPREKDVALQPRRTVGGGLRPLQRLVDFVQFGFVHELPELKLRILETLDLLDELHVAEADLDYQGRPKNFSFPEAFRRIKKDFRERLGREDLAEQMDQKIFYQAVHIPQEKKGYNRMRTLIGEGLRGVGRCVDEGQKSASERPSESDSSRRQESCLLLESDSDEILSRPVLRALRHCEPEDGLGYGAYGATRHDEQTAGRSSTRLPVTVSMRAFFYSLEWTGRGGAFWTIPNLVHSVENPETVVQGYGAEERVGVLSRGPLDASVDVDREEIFGREVEEDGDELRGDDNHVDRRLLGGGGTMELYRGGREDDEIFGREVEVDEDVVLQDAAGDERSRMRMPRGTSAGDVGEDAAGDERSRTSATGDFPHDRRRLYVFFGPRPTLELYRTDGKTTSWHLSWMMDGAEGLANKALNGRTEGTPPYVLERFKAGGRGAVVALYAAMLRDPRVLFRYERDLTYACLPFGELPESLQGDRWVGGPQKGSVVSAESRANYAEDFRNILGEGFYRVLGGQGRLVAATGNSTCSVQQKGFVGR